MKNGTILWYSSSWHPILCSLTFKWHIKLWKMRENINLHKLSPELKISHSGEWHFIQPITTRLTTAMSSVWQFFIPSAATLICSMGKPQCVLFSKANVKWLQENCLVFFLIGKFKIWRMFGYHGNACVSEKWYSQMNFRKGQSSKIHGQNWHARKSLQDTRKCPYGPILIAPVP